MDNRFNHLLFLCAVFTVFICCFQDVTWAGNDIREETLEDGVKHWFRVRDTDKKPWFFKQLENVLDVVLSDGGGLPFDRSVAFLAGVSRYEHLSPQLDFVKNDLEALRLFLLNQGGFDEVYSASDEVVTPALLNRYMRNKFRRSLKKNDRLLFYYSGHGADLGGRTGYIQLSRARPDDFAANVLRIDECEEWSRFIPAGHLLFIYDCCVSGLAFTAKSGDSDSYRRLLSTLSGNGSRTVITAGTASEKTFGVREHSVFTKAFLDSLRNARKNTSGFVTINQVFAQTEINVKEFARRYDKKLTPRRWELEEDKYRGTFVFVDSNAKNVKLDGKVRESLPVVPKGEIVAEYGIILLTSYVTGKVFIDGTDMGNIEQGDAKRYYDQIVGRHEVEVCSGSRCISRTADVAKGKETRVRIRPAEASVTTTSVPRLTPTTLPEKEPETEGTWTDPVTGMEFVWVPKGCFKMGSPPGEKGRYSDEGPVHEVCVDGFWMGKYEVTNKQYRKYKSGHNSGDYEGNFLDGDNQPAVRVSWDDAKAFAKWLTGKSRHEFRLPTEAEWEYACRAGTQTARFWGDDPDDACRYASVADQTHNCDDGYAVTAPVGSFSPNSFRLYDMLGNIWEWCEDIYDSDAYRKHKRNNPIYADGGSDRVRRGGSWYGKPAYVRCAERDHYSPASRGNLLGFRLVRTP
ncbi:SUMF1/EgtB/PvdO family nonheme iron enzyme [Desulfococcaceae bacterium HSG8]|nr:SUMF1/EgtB/PvdO family nonheme iron enzyme [Desulfococcaceae bacterium HSG8]